MKYAIFSSEQWDEKLARIWLQAPDRDSVAAAMDRIERALRADPDRAGMPQGEARRIVDGPIAVTFVVSRQDLRVDLVNITHRG
jgi:hypothetical protein